MSELFHSTAGSDWLFELIICFFLLVGGIFCLGGSIGLLRFPDIYCKMQALSKPVTLGIFNLIIAYILFLLYAGIGLSLKGLLAVVFLLLTIPIGSHMMIKAAYRSGVPIWTESLMDQLADIRTEVDGNPGARIRAEVDDEEQQTASPAEKPIWEPAEKPTGEPAETLAETQAGQAAKAPAEESLAEPTEEPTE